MIEVIGSVFAGAGKIGDFAWMIRQPEYADVLFVFNDNEEQFRAYRKDPQGSYGCSPGGGNAIIRPYQCQSPPRAGIRAAISGSRTCTALFSAESSRDSVHSAPTRTCSRAIAVSPRLFVRSTRTR